MIIGLSGLKSSGKSTVAKYLCEKYNFIEFSFAAPIKQGLMEMLDLTAEQVLIDKETPDAFWGVTPRKLMQVIGTDLMRNHLPTYIPEMKNVWIRLMEKKVLAHPHQNIVISDCRFLDEACFIRNQKGTLLRISRPSLIASDMHESEQLGFEVDYEVSNSKTIGDLEESMDRILRKIQTQSVV